METFILLMVFAMPNGELEEYTADSELTYSECVESGKNFERDNGGVIWECVRVSDE